MGRLPNSAVPRRVTASPRATGSNGSSTTLGTPITTSAAAALGASLSDPAKATSTANGDSWGESSTPCSNTARASQVKTPSASVVSVRAPLPVTSTSTSGTG